MVKVDAEALKWAVEELRGLDELCRSMIPAYDPFHSGDMDKLHLLERAAKEAK